MPSEAITIFRKTGLIACKTGLKVISAARLVSDCVYRCSGNLTMWMPGGCWAQCMLRMMMTLKPLQPWRMPSRRTPQMLRWVAPVCTLNLCVSLCVCYTYATVHLCPLHTASARHQNHTLHESSHSATPLYMARPIPFRFCVFMDCPGQKGLACTSLLVWFAVRMIPSAPVVSSASPLWRCHIAMPTRQVIKQLRLLLVVLLLLLSLAVGHTN